MKNVPKTKTGEIVARNIRIYAAIQDIPMHQIVESVGMNSSNFYRILARGKLNLELLESLSSALDIELHQLVRPFDMPN